MIKELKYENHDEWLSIRSKYIGGSDASAVIGMNPYKSAYTLWAEKTGKVEPFSGNLTTRVGAYLEDMVAHLFEEETGKKVRRKNATMVNDLYPFACANVDRLVVGEKALLEIKTTNSIPIMKQLKTEQEFPDAYYAQVVHYLAVTGLEKAYLAVLINCRELKVYEMDRDQDEIDALMVTERQFWTNVERGIAPLPDGSDSSVETLKLLYPEASADKIDLNAFDSSLSEYVSLGKQIKDLKKMQDEVGNIVKDYMQEAGKGESARFKVSYGNQTRKTFDSKRFCKENSTMDLTDYWNETQTRVFKVTEK